MTMEPEAIETGEAIAAKFDAEYEALMETIRPLNDDQLAAPSTPTEWSVKDHLAHLAVWAAGIVVLLKGQDRWALMGVDRTQVKAMSVDEINAVIYEQHKDEALADVLTFFKDTHTTFRDRIQELSADALALPYDFYQPDAPVKNDAPIIGWIVNDSYAHYAEHRGWIEAMIAEKGWG